MQQVPTITVFDIKTFRSWLKKHHKKEGRLAVLIHKRHTGKPAPTHREFIEEAICFGWIDTTIKRIDEDTFVRHFTKRGPGSRWSDNTLKYARQLIKAGRMTPEGLRFYKLGLLKPTHDHGIPKDPVMPLKLKKALARDKKAKMNFEAFPPSVKRAFYRWLLRAKLPVTQDKRTAYIVRSALLKNKNVFRPVEKQAQG